MYDNESLSDAWNEGFEAGLDFAKTMIHAEHNSHPTVIVSTPKHHATCLIYICTCENKDK